MGACLQWPNAIRRLCQAAANTCSLATREDTQGLGHTQSCVGGGAQAACLGSRKALMCRERREGVRDERWSN